MKAYDTDTENALAARGIVERGMVLFDFPSASYGFWDGLGTLTYNSVDYKPGGQVLEIEAADQTLGLSANSLTIKLYANPDAGLTPNVLTTIEAEAYHQRPVTIMRAIFDAATNELISVLPIWRGVVDRIEHQRGGDGSYVLVGYCESKSIDYTKRGTAMASNAHQQAVYTGDVFFEFAGYGYETLQIVFGSKTPENFLPSRKAQPVL